MTETVIFFIIMIKYLCLSFKTKLISGMLINFWILCLPVIRVIFKHTPSVTLSNSVLSLKTFLSVLFYLIKAMFFSIKSGFDVKEIQFQG